MCYYRYAGTCGNNSVNGEVMTRTRIITCYVLIAVAVSFPMLLQYRAMLDGDEVAGAVAQWAGTLHVCEILRNNLKIKK